MEEAVNLDVIRKTREEWARENAAALAQVRDAALLPALGFSCLNLRRHGEKVLTEELDRLLIESMVCSDIWGGAGIARGAIFLVTAEPRNDGDDFMFNITLPLAQGELG